MLYQINLLIFLVEDRELMFCVIVGNGISVRDIWLGIIKLFFVEDVCIFMVIGVCFIYYWNLKIDLWNIFFIVQVYDLI